VAVAVAVATMAADMGVGVGVGVGAGMAGVTTQAATRSKLNNRAGKSSGRDKVITGAQGCEESLNGNWQVYRGS